MLNTSNQMQRSRGEWGNCGPVVIMVRQLCIQCSNNYPTLSYTFLKGKWIRKNISDIGCPDFRKQNERVKVTHLS